MLWATRALCLTILVAMSVTSVPTGSAQQSQPVESRRGVVRGEGRAFADAGGPFLARGASLFWGLWGYQHDRERLARNLAVLRDAGFHYVRVLGVVGAPPSRPDQGWRDRSVDPGAATYDRDIAGFTDWVHQSYGLRVQWTIFGGVDFIPTPDARRALVQRFAAMSRGREEKIFGFEIANEAWQNGFAGEEGRQELRALGQLLSSQTSVLVALSSSPGARCDGADGLQSLYKGAGADFATLHFERRPARGLEVWRVLRGPWDFGPCDGLPALASSNEPIGPESSIAAIDDPLVLSMLALVTYGSGVGAFVLHSGPGVRGGGAADLRLGRHSNLWEIRNADGITQGLRTLERLLPRDLANWEKRDSSEKSPERPFDVGDRGALSGLYCFAKREEAVCGAAGVARPLELIARRRMTVTAYHPVDGRSISTKEMGMGERFGLKADPQAVIVKVRSR